MSSAFEPLVEIIHSGKLDDWKARNESALASLFGSRYAKKADKAVMLRAPEMKGGDNGVPFASYIHPGNQASGGYGGMSFVVFPVEDEPCLVGMVVGTQGLAPDETILGRPGHARKMGAIASWLNHRFGQGQQVAWAKQDPTRIDIDVPDRIKRAWSEYDRVYKKYGPVIYALYRPTTVKDATLAAVSAMLDTMFEERGEPPLKPAQEDSLAIQSAWLEHLMPSTDEAQVIELLNARKFVILQGPPGTGKTRLARRILARQYAEVGRSIQFHPNTTYENFVGGLAPVQTAADRDSVGFHFAPCAGFLVEAAAAAAADPAKPYLLHIDEINRADLGKILGEAIYLFEPDAESPREIHLPYDFGPPFHRNLSLPDNLHILGTMNSADRSIAIVDIAVRRRFAFLSLWPSFAVVAEHGCELTQRAFRDMVSIFVEHAPDDALALMPGHSYFLAKDEEQAKLNLRANLAPLLVEYLAQGYISGFAEPIRSYLQWLDSL